MEKCRHFVCVDNQRVRADCVDKSRFFLSLFCLSILLFVIPLQQVKPIIAKNYEEKNYVHHCHCKYGIPGFRLCK